MPRLKSLEDYFKDELKVLYKEEKPLINPLPKMSNEASPDSLNNEYEDHFLENELQLNRPNKISKHSASNSITGRKSTYSEEFTTHAEAISTDAAGTAQVEN